MHCAVGHKGGVAVGEEIAYNSFHVDSGVLIKDSIIVVFPEITLIPFKILPLNYIKEKSVVGFLLYTYVTLPLIRRNYNEYRKVQSI